MADPAVGMTDVVHAPIDAIIEALTDFESFPVWQAMVTGCEVVERDADGRGSLVRMRVDAKVRKVDFVVRYSYDLPHSLGWVLVSGDLTENTGTYLFRPRGDGATDVSVDIRADIGLFIPGPIKKLIRDQAVRTSIRELKRRVEG